MPKPVRDMPDVRKVTTTGQVALFWYDTQDDARNDGTSENRENLLYWGARRDIPRDLAMRIATLHPDFANYHADALATLWKLNDSREGTEDPVLALTYKVPEELDWVVIRQVVEHMPVINLGYPPAPIKTRKHVNARP